MKPTIASQIVRASRGTTARAWSSSRVAADTGATVPSGVASALGWPAAGADSVDIAAGNGTGLASAGANAIAGAAGSAEWDEVISALSVDIDEGIKVDVSVGRGVRVKVGKRVTITIRPVLDPLDAQAKPAIATTTIAARKKECRQRSVSLS